MNNSVVLLMGGQHVMFGVGIVQGLLSGLNNLLLLSTILFQRELRARKEHVVILSVALADLFQGCAQVVLLVALLSRSLISPNIQPVLRQHCLLTGVPVLPIFTQTMQATMLMLQSTDRLLAVSKPLYYFGTTVSLPWRMCLAGFMYSFGQTVLLVWLSLDTSDVAAFNRCIPLTALKPAVFTYWTANHIILGNLSVLLFGLVMVLYRRHMNTVAPDTERQLQEHMATQRRVTVSMGLSCAATLALFVAPRIINLILVSLVKYTPAHISFLQDIAFLAYNCNPILNFYIYIKRHENIRKGLKLMLKGKQLSLTRVPEREAKNAPVCEKQNQGKPGVSAAVRHGGLQRNTGITKPDGRQTVGAKHMLVRYSTKKQEVCNTESN